MERVSIEVAEGQAYRRNHQCADRSARGVISRCGLHPTKATVPNAPNDPGSFYLAYVNRSRASALRGPMTSLRRSIIEHKAKGSIDRNLREIKARIEALR